MYKVCVLVVHCSQSNARMKAVVFSVNISVISCVGKDITHKLYSLNEHLGALASGDIAADMGRQPDHWRSISRSLSVDAVHTGTRGHVRSLAWRNQQQRRTSATFSDRKLACLCMPCLSG